MPKFIEILNEAMADARERFGLVIAQPSCGITDCWHIYTIECIRSGREMLPVCSVLKEDGHIKVSWPPQ